MTASDSPHRLIRLVEEQLVGLPGLQAVVGWFLRYLKNQPVQSLGAGESQVVLGVRAIQYLVTDLFTGRFLVGEFTR